MKRDMKMKGASSLNIDSIPTMALALFTAIVTIAIIALVVVNMMPASYRANTIYNYTFTANVTSLPYIDAGYNNLSIACFNSSGVAMASTNFTYWDNNNTLMIRNGVDTGGYARSCTYQYSAFTNATSVLSKGTVALASFADWFGILVIVIISVIILGLVMFLKGRGGEA